jgi:opacity protein-like surface antigen
MKKIFTILLFTMFCAQGNSQKLGLILKGSSTGIGADLGYRINSKFLVKAGVDQIKYNLNTSLESGETSFDANGSIGAGTVGLLLDYQIFKKIYVSGGLVMNNFETNFKGKVKNDITFGDVIIDKDKIGEINWTIKPKSTIAPYIGLGIGNLLNQNKKLNIGFEIGSIFQGPPNFKIVSNGFFSANSSPEFDQAGKLNSNFSSFQFYPVIKLNIAYALKTF